MSFVATFPEPNVGRANSLPFSLIAEGVMRSRRNCAESTCLFSAARSPEIFSPAEFVPVNVNTAIFNLRPTKYQVLPHLFAQRQVGCVTISEFAPQPSLFRAALLRDSPSPAIRPR